MIPLHQSALNFDNDNLHSEGYIQIKSCFLTNKEYNGMGQEGVYASIRPSLDEGTSFSEWSQPLKGPLLRRGRYR